MTPFSRKQSLFYQCSVSDRFSWRRSPSFLSNTPKKMAESSGAEEPVIKEADARAMVALLGKVIGINGPAAEKRKQLMNGICELIDASFWVWATMGRTEEGEMVTFSLRQQGGFSDQQMAGYLKAQEHPDMARLNVPLLAEYTKKEGHLTRTDWQLIAIKDYLDTEVSELFAKAGLGPVVLSFYPLDNGQTSGIAIYRSDGKEYFSPRDSRIAHILLSEVSWLHQDNRADENVKEVHQLSPRMNTVLNLSLQGLPRKQIADQLELSIHTVNDYVKKLYSRFKVHSQSELIRRFMEGDGGDAPSI